MTYIHVELVGRVATTPVHATVRARRVTNLRVAIDRPSQGSHSGRTSPPLFLSVCIWDNVPDHQLLSLTKGQTVKVTGRLDTRTSAHTGLTYTHVVTDSIQLMQAEIHRRAA